MKFHPLANLFPLISKDSLAVFFGIPTIIVTAEPVLSRSMVSPDPEPARWKLHNSKQAKGQRALRRQRIRLVERVAELHHGIQEGHRIHALLVMAPCLRGADNRERRVEDFNRRCCQPPLPAKELEHVLKAGRRTIAFKDATLVKWLGLTGDEVDLLKGEGLLSRPAERPRLRQRRERRELLKQLWARRVATGNDRATGCLRAPC